MKNKLSLLFVVLLSCILHGTREAASQTCVDHTGETSFSDSSGGLNAHYFFIKLAAKGNYLFLLDGHDLNSINLEDPDDWVVEQEIDFSPTDLPTDMIRVGENRLYLFKQSLVSIFDTSDPSTLTFVGDVPIFGQGEYIGEYDNMLYFVEEPTAGDLTITCYSTINPDSPVLISSWVFPIEGGQCAGAAIGKDRIFVLTSNQSTPNYGDGYVSDFYILDISTPGTFVLVNHYMASDLPDEFVLTYIFESFNSSYSSNIREPMFTSGNQLYIGYSNVLPYTPNEPMKSTILDISDPDNPTPYGGAPYPEYTKANCIVYAAENGIHYGKTRFDFEYDLHFGPGLFSWPYEVGTIAVTDRAVAFSSDFYDNFDRLIATQRQCDPPSIVQGSVSNSLEFRADGKVDLTVKWRTLGWTDPLFDKVTLTDAPRNPPAAQIGTVVLNGGSTVNLSGDGTWIHERTYRFNQCVPKARYSFAIQSERTGLTESANGGYIIFPKFCFGTLEFSPPIAGVELHSAPNPFNPSTMIEFSVPPSYGSVRVGIYGVDGRRITSLYEGSSPAGTLRVEWDGRDQSGRRVQSGTYFVRLETKNIFKTQKLVLLK